MHDQRPHHSGMNPRRDELEEKSEG
jgi:hypothetical protein